MDQRYMEILLEEIRGKFDLVLEGHESLRGEIRELARRTDERFDLVDLKFAALSHRIDTVEQRLDAKIDAVEQRLSARIDAVESNLSTVAADLAAVAADLSAHRRDTECHGGYRVGE
jgi:cytochrome c556